MRTLELFMIMVVVATVATAISIALILNQTSSNNTQTNFMTQESATSLYHQFGFDVKIPSYLPKGFVPLGSEASRFPSELTEYFGDKTLLGPNSTDTWYKIRSCRPACSIITVGAEKYIGQNSTRDLYLWYLTLQNASSTLHSTPTFSVTNGTVFMQPSANFPPILIAKGDVQYLIDGRVPVEELTKVAKSLS